MPEPLYEIRPSVRRRRTMSAFRENGRLVVAVPASLSLRQQRELIPPLVEKFLAKEKRADAPRGEADLTARTRALYTRFLAPALRAEGGSGDVPTFGVRWVSNQGRRWGSCTPSTGEIRISDRLVGMPGWVVDFVLIHEATHLIERHHTARFKALVARYPLAERAEAFLAGVDHATGQGSDWLD